ncbi:MAG: DUF3873 domain-containing protein [Tannerella sp.]|nr:DUF3873 domain-containing protein [Tannerella sp.]
MNTENSINQNGCSVCRPGEENYTAFRPSHRPETVLYQYDYRHKDSQLFYGKKKIMESIEYRFDTSY